MGGDRLAGVAFGVFEGVRGVWLRVWTVLYGYEVGGGPLVLATVLFEGFLLFYITTNIEKQEMLPLVAKIDLVGVVGIDQFEIVALRLIFEYTLGTYCIFYRFWIRSVNGVGGCGCFGCDYY